MKQYTANFFNITMAFFKRLDKINCHSYTVKTRSDNNLLEHQKKALEKLCKWFEPSDPQQNQIALVSMPTGSGKTGIMACLPYFLGYFGLSYIPEANVVVGDPDYPFNKPILVIAPNLEIAKQLKEQLSVSTSGGPDETFLIRRGIVPLEEHRDVLPTVKTIESKSELTGEHALQSYDMIMANFQKFCGEFEGNWEKALPDDMFRLVIVDEAHHHPAKTWRRIVQKFQGHALVAFFTATPYRNDGNLVLEKDTPIVYHLRLEEAVNAGVIRQAVFEECEEIGSLENFNIKTGTTPDDITNMRRWLPILGKVKILLELKNGADRLSQTRDSVAHMAIAIAGNKWQADLLLDLWKARICPDDAPDTAETYHSEKPKYEKQQIMSRLKNNKLKLVIVVEMLLEGFDYPPISIAAITCKIGSPVKFVQFVGRAQRVYRGPGSIGKNETAHIITHKDYDQLRNFESFQSGEFIP